MRSFKKYFLKATPKSTQTAKPSPPEIIKNVMITFNVGFNIKSFKLEDPKLSKPALQNADTAKKYY